MQYILSYVISVSLLHRLDEAAVSLQKEKNMYKEIENYPTCFKVYFYVFSKLCYLALHWCIVLTTRTLLDGYL